MESDKQEALKAPESQDDLLNKKVGTLEPEKLQAKKITVKDISIQNQTKKDSDKVVGKMVHLMCKHPDKEELLDMTRILYRKNPKASVTDTGLWYNEDKEKNIQKGSPVAILMEYFSVKLLKELEGKELETEANDAGYLGIKAYK